MGPLIHAVAAVCLLLSAQALPENIEDVKSLSQFDSPVLEAEETSPQTRKERCTTCGNGNVLAPLQNLPAGTEVHSQSSFEGCSSDKGCAGIKVKDGQVLEKFGNIDAFKAAAEADTGNEFTFHAAGNFGNGVFQAGIPKEGPFWWMNENSPFKAGAAGGGNYEKFSKSSSSSFSSNGGATGGNGGAGFTASLDLSGNPYLNGDFSKLASGFAGQGANQFAQGQESSSSFAKPGGGNYQSSFESSSFSTSSKNGEVDISKNPFLNGGFKNQAGFQGQAGFGTTGSSGSTYQASQGSNKFGAGYVGSSPQPFTASTAGTNVNLIQNTQKASEFDYEQQQQSQQNIDEVFQETGNVHAHEHSGGELQQTCAGQGYVCVHKAQCNNGVVNTNGAGILQAKTKKQYCNTKTEICCRIEISTLQGAGGLQGSLGVGQATYNGGSATQGGGLFVSTSQGAQGGSNSFGQSGSAFGSESGSSRRDSTTTSFGSESSSTRGSGSSFGSDSSRGTGFGSEAGQRGQAGTGFGAQGGYGTQTSTFESSSSSFGSNSNTGNGFGAQGNNGNGFNAQGSSSFGQTGSSFGTQNTQNTQNTGSFGTQGQNTGFGATGGNRGVTVETSSFESSTTRGTNFGGNGGKFGTTGGFGSTGAGSSFGATAGSNSFGATNKFAGAVDTNDVLVKGTTTKTQTNFVETDTFSSGSDATGIYRPGAGGSGLKPGIPYLPPDNSNSGSSFVSTTAFPTTTPRPVYTTSKPTYLPPSTQAPGYLPPVGEQSINTETRVPVPNYNTGGILLDETRTTPRPRKPVPANNEIPAGCAAALKCTPVEFCTAEGVMSKTAVVLTKDQEAFRVPLTDCKDLESGQVGKCCRDPDYSDPWPTNLIGKWTQGVFGGNDGKYTPDSRGSPSISRPVATVKPPVTGSVVLNNFRSTTKPTIPAFGPNQVTPGTPTATASSFAQKGQFEIRNQGQYTQGGQGQYTKGGQGQFTQGGIGQLAQGGIGQLAQAGQGQYSEGSQGQFAQGGLGQFAVGGQGQIGQGGQQTSQFTSTQTKQTFQTQNQRGQGQTGPGVGQTVSQGQGQIVTQGGGAYQKAGQGQFGVGGLGQIEIEEQNSQSQFTSIQGQNQAQGNRATASASAGRGQGQIVSQGQGQLVSQGQGSGVRQGAGFAASQGGGFGVENDYSESVQRVFLQRYSGGGQCGLLNGQKPYGNRNELEVDFAEIPWQAMVLLQTNKSLLCGGVITRPDVVVTTASCVDGLQAKNVLIKGGEWKLGIDDEPLPFQIVQVKNILRHPFYKSGSFQYDAAILVLTENLRLAKNIYPICLPGAQDTLDGFYNGAGECIVTGWGKQVLQAHLAGSLLHSLNISLINPGECQSKLSQDYPHLLEQYDQESCACGVPTNPINNICRVDTGSALACTTGDGHFVLRGVYSWDSGCQPGNQLAAFYKFDLEWYEWAIGQLESNRFAQFSSSSQSSRSEYSSQIKGGQRPYNGGIKIQGGGIKAQGAGIKSGQGFSASASAGFGGGYNQGGQYSQFASKFSESSTDQSVFPQGIKPIQGSGQYNQYSTKYSESSSDQSNYPQGVKPIQGSGQYNQFSTKYSESSSDQSNYPQGVKPIQGSGQYNQFSTKYSESSSDQSNYPQGVKPIQGSGQYNQFSTKYSESSSDQSNYPQGVKPIQGSGQYNQFATKYSESSSDQTGFPQGIKPIQGSGQYSQFASKFTDSDQGSYVQGVKPIQNSFSATYSEKKIYQSEPKIVTFTTKPEIVTFTTKPELFTYTTKPKIVTYTTKPQIITYETSGSGNNPQYVAPGVTFNPSFGDLVGKQHVHNAQCKCLEQGKK